MICTRDNTFDLHLGRSARSAGDNLNILRGNLGSKILESYEYHAQFWTLPKNHSGRRPGILLVFYYEQFKNSMWKTVNRKICNRCPLVGALGLQAGGCPKKKTTTCAAHILSVPIFLFRSLNELPHRWRYCYIRHSILQGVKEYAYRPSLSFLSGP